MEGGIAARNAVPHLLEQARKGSHASTSYGDDVNVHGRLVPDAGVTARGIVVDICPSRLSTIALGFRCIVQTALRHRTLQIGALCLLLASAYHGAALLWSDIDPTSSPLRHALFVLINLAIGAGLWFRPLGFFWVFAALTVQQLHSHGRALLRAVVEEQRFDWASAAVVVGLPVILWLLWQERRHS